jgi:hypothetical protein
LYTVLSTGPNATDPVIYGSNTNAFVLAQNEVVEIVLNNDDPGKCVFPSFPITTISSLCPYRTRAYDMAYTNIRNIDTPSISTVMPSKS